MAPQFSSYWGHLINAIEVNSDDAHLIEIEGNPNLNAYERYRLPLYDGVRNVTGLSFPDFGDDIPRWLAWLRANDTEDYAEQCRRDIDYWQEKYGHTDLAGDPSALINAKALDAEIDALLDRAGQYGTYPPR